MAYTPQTWANLDPTTPVSADRLNHIESGIAAADTAAAAAAAGKAPVSTTTIDLVDRTNNTTETVPAGTTTNCSTAGVTKTAPALDNPVATPPKRFAIKNLSTGSITVAYPDQAGNAQSLTILTGETRTFRQKTTSGWGVESGAVATATYDARFAPIRVDTSAAVAGPAYTNPRPAMDLLMDTAGAASLTAYDTGGADSTADLQAVLDAALANINAGSPLQRIRLNSRAKYVVGGAVQTGAHGELAQLLLSRPTNPGQAGTIEIVGGSFDGIRAPGILGAAGLTSRTIIESTLSSAPTFAGSTGIASILGATSSYSTTNADSFSPIRLGLKGLAFRTPNAPVIAGVDAGHLEGLFFDDLVFDTDKLAGMDPTLSMLAGYYAMLASGTYQVPSSPQAVPLIVPLVGTVFGTNGGRLSVAGWGTGPQIGEYGDIDHVEVFGVPGPAVCMDAANQPFRIGTLIDLNNAYGIGAVNPASALAVSPGTTGLASRKAVTANNASGKLDIGTWMIQLPEASPVAPTALARVNDVLDGNALCEISASFRKVQGGTGVRVNSLSIIGNGNSLTGRVFRTRIVDAAGLPGSAWVVASPPASGVAIRNPTNRDSIAYASVAGGSITGYTIQGSGSYGVPPASGIPIPANAIHSYTYTGTLTLYYIGF